MAILKLMFQIPTGMDHPAKTSKVDQNEGGLKEGMLFSFLFVTLDHLHVFPGRYNCPVSLDYRSLNLMMSIMERGELGFLKIIME